MKYMNLHLYQVKMNLEFHSNTIKTTIYGLSIVFFQD